MQVVVRCFCSCEHNARSVPFPSSAGPPFRRCLEICFGIQFSTGPFSTIAQKLRLHPVRSPMTPRAVLSLISWQRAERSFPGRPRSGRQFRKAVFPLRGYHSIHRSGGDGERGMTASSVRTPGLSSFSGRFATSCVRITIPRSIPICTMIQSSHRSKPRSINDLAFRFP